MGVNISGSGILSGIASLIVGAVNNLNLLVTKIIGYTTGTGGGSSYYTTTVGTYGPAYLLIPDLAANGGMNVGYYSEDGISWNEITTPPLNISSKSIINYNDNFYLADGNSYYIKTSTDGVTWTNLVQLDSYGQCIAAGNGIVLASSFFSTNAKYSLDNGQSWNSTSLPFSASSIVYFNNQFIAYQPVNLAQIATSTDGVNWTTATAQGITTALDNIVSNNSMLLALSAPNYSLSDTFQYSTDGINWTTASTGVLSGEKIASIVYASGKFTVFGVDTGATRSAISTDGSIWTENIFSNSLVTSSLPYTGKRYTVSYGKVNMLKEVQVSIGDQGSGGAEILAPVDVYTVPAGKTTQIDRITIKNNSSNTISFDLGFLDPGVEISDQNARINDSNIYAGQTVTYNSILVDGGGIDLSINPGQRVVIFPSTVDVVEVKVYGTESNI